MRRAKFIYVFMNKISLKKEEIKKKFFLQFKSDLFDNREN